MGREGEGREEEEEKGKGRRGEGKEGKKIFQRKVGLQEPIIVSRWR